jgi:hypothetical protein
VQACRVESIWSHRRSTMVCPAQPLDALAVAVTRRI